MHTPNPNLAAGRGRHPVDEQRLREEIAYFEKRLCQMGLAGDCAYERALAAAFRALLQERRTLLGMTASAGG